MRTRLVVLPIVLALTACGSSQKPTTTDHAGGGDGAAAPAAVTLLDVSQGDAACYVTVRTAAGEEQTHPATFDVCPGGGADASAYVGMPVELQWSRASMMGATCEGDPDCPDTEEVDVVTSVTPVQ